MPLWAADNQDCRFCKSVERASSPGYDGDVRSDKWEMSVRMNRSTPDETGTHNRESLDSSSCLLRMYGGNSLLDAPE